MSQSVHTVDQGPGSAFAQPDRVVLYNLCQAPYVAGNGDPSAIAAGTPGASYAAIPTVAFANKGSGSGETATAVMEVLGATVAAGGTGGTPGAVTITGTDGTGTKFQATGTINGSGVLTGALVVTVAGAYTALPGDITHGAVSGGSLTGATVALNFGVASYTLGGSSNHQYPQGTTATVSGGTPTTPAVPGAVTVTPVAGQGALLSFSGLKLPANFTVIPGDPGQDAVVFVSSRSQTALTLTVNPRLASETLAAGSLDVLIVH